MATADGYPMGTSGFPSVFPASSHCSKSHIVCDRDVRDWPQPRPRMIHHTNYVDIYLSKYIYIYIILYIYITIYAINYIELYNCIWIYIAHIHIHIYSYIHVRYDVSLLHTEIGSERRCLPLQLEW
jgi:hypothetical protein